MALSGDLVHDYEVAWRLKTLIVRPCSGGRSPLFAQLERDEQQIVDCLFRSPVQRVRLDLALPEGDVRRWVNAAHQAGKAVFLRLPGAAGKPEPFWRLRAGLNVLGAAVLWLGLSPLMLAVSIAVLWRAPGSPLFERRWCVGDRGRLFLAWQFCRPPGDAESLGGKGQGRSPLYRLPRLLNVMRGEMSLLGLPAISLAEALRLGPELKLRSTRKPGLWAWGNKAAFEKAAEKTVVT